LDKHNTQNKGLPDSRLWEKLNCACFAISRLRELELAQFSITIEQLSVLRIVLDNGGETIVAEIVDKTMRKSNSVYMLVNRMHKMGLVTKLKKMGDKKHHIAITSEGKDLVGKLTMVSPQMVFSPLTIQEKVKLNKIFDLLVGRARQLLGIPHHPPITVYLDNSSGSPADNISRNHQTKPEAVLWSIMNGTRFAISKVREIELARFGLSIEQSSILNILSDHGGQTTIKQIVDKTMRQPHSVYTLVNRMQKMGLIVKTKKTRDKEYQIAMTDEGKKLFANITGCTALELSKTPVAVKGKCQYYCLAILSVLHRRTIRPVLSRGESQLPSQDFQSG
jgi:DNA-binding MarR family transcriptional regulator